VASFDDLRREYAGRPLVEAEAGSDPFALFGCWFDEAVAAGAELANGMVLATSSKDGQPSARVVLLKAWDREGFVFFSNYESRKGRELDANPAAALLFWWEVLHRQVRIEGRALRIAPAESDAYFASRPRASNLAAIASAQSATIASRSELERAVAREAEASDGGDLRRPAFWGGYRLSPQQFEFWQGRPDRIHDRLRYSGPPRWTRQRLCP
jgi:pyridoxamine 5'-phosphate oxidase